MDLCPVIILTVVVAACSENMNINLIEEEFHDLLLCNVILGSFVLFLGLDLIFYQYAFSQQTLPYNGVLYVDS